MFTALLLSAIVSLTATVFATEPQLDSSDATIEADAVSESSGLWDGLKAGLCL